MTINVTLQPPEETIQGKGKVETATQTPTIQTRRTGQGINTTTASTDVDMETAILAPQMPALYLATQYG